MCVHMYVCTEAMSFYDNKCIHMRTVTEQFTGSVPHPCTSAVMYVYVVEPVQCQYVYMYVCTCVCLWHLLLYGECVCGHHTCAA